MNKFIWCLSLFIMPVSAMNIIKLYDTLLWPYYSAEKKVQMYGISYGGIYTCQFNNEKSIASPLHIWDEVKNGVGITTENGLGMLKGYSYSTAIAQKSTQVDASDDGQRGHLSFDGKFRIVAGGGVAGRFFFHDTWSIGVYVPTYIMRLSHVSYKDFTLLETDEDRRTRAFLTDCSVLPEQTRILGDNLDLGGWQRSGIGDIVTQVEWYRDFIQARPILRNVRLNWRVGIGYPTGLRADEDKLLAFAFGHDGAWFIPFGIGLDFTLGSSFRSGFDVELTHVFGHMRRRRIKTYPTQTDLLLLTKIDAYKDAGLDQRYNLYIEWLTKKFSLKFGYQYRKQGEDSISFNNLSYNTSVANTLIKLRDRTMQQFFVLGSYDISTHESGYAQTQLGLFSYIPINGQHSLMQQTVGLIFVVNF